MSTDDTSSTDAARRALDTYDTLIRVGDRSVLAWRRVAIDLCAASHGAAGERRRLLVDRSNDAHMRADTYRRSLAS